MKRAMLQSMRSLAGVGSPSHQFYTPWALLESKADEEKSGVISGFKAS